jgi:ribosome maturation protein SDO1
MEWRSGVETDLSEVIQTDTIFSNVSKGQLAPHSDLLKAFPAAAPPDKKHSASSSSSSTTTTTSVLPSEEILLEILKNGELQVSDKERAQALVDKRKEIIHLVAEKTVDPLTNRPHTSSMIEKAIDELHLSVNLSKSSKTQVRRRRKKIPSIKLHDSMHG